MYNMSDVEEGRRHKLYDTWQVADSIVIWQCKIITQGYQEVHGSCSGVRKGVWEYLSKLIFFFNLFTKNVNSVAKDNREDPVDNFLQVSEMTDSCKVLFKQLFLQRRTIRKRKIHLQYWKF